jgi:hypothetical protein
MKTKLNLVAAGLFLAALGTGFGQPVITQQAAVRDAAELGRSVCLERSHNRMNREAVATVPVPAKGLPCNIQHPTSNIERPSETTKSQAGQCDIKATPKRVDSQGIATRKPP